MADSHKNSKLVQFWVKEHILTKWDAFCEQYGVNRTSFIIQACNDYLFKYQGANKEAIEETQLKTELATLQDRVIDALDKMEKHASENVDPKLRARISNYLQKHPASEVEDFNDIIGLSPDGLLDALNSMKADKIVTCSNKGKWSLKA